MTSTTGMDSHPEVPEISDLSEGLLTPERGAEVRLHIAGCALCADVLSSLEEIRGLLGTLPGPQRMPADIAGRIDAALAAEALLDATRPDVPRGTSPSGPTRVPRETSPGSGGHTGRGTGPGRSGGTGIHPSGRRRRRLFLAAAGIASALVLGTVVYEAGSGQTSGSSDSSASAMKSGKAGVSSGDSVASEVRRLLGDPNTATEPASPMIPHHADTPMLSQGTTGAGQDSDSVPSCALKATHRSQTPLAAERDVFRGQEAYLVVLPHAGDASLVDAFVVSASCTPTSPGAVLFQASYPR